MKKSVKNYSLRNNFLLFYLKFIDFIKRKHKIIIVPKCLQPYFHFLRFNFAKFSSFTGYSILKWFDHSAFLVLQPTNKFVFRTSTCLWMPKPSRILQTTKYLPPPLPSHPKKSKSFF